MKKYFLLSFLVALGFIILFNWNCKNTGPVAASNPFLNVNDSVKLVGMQTCKGCHADIYNSFIKTGMGQSFDLATPHKSAARFGLHEVVYDTLNNLYYHPYWNNDELFIKEYRLNGTDTIHSRTEKVKYIVGSGQHTNSHLVDINGYLYQAPITFYTQKGIWDLAPGFEKGSNSKFTRIIGQECMTCHNHYPEPGDAENNFKTIKTGIECERCHGAGSLHVAEKQKGHLVDIKSQTDYTIVNPKKLNREQQISLCQRCHLQGITVLENGKTFFDFKPSMLLSEVMYTFTPRYTDSVEHFIMASHADRMKLSKCFRSSQMTCLSCHNPHVSVKFTPQKTFISACKNCHADNKNSCTETEANRKLKQNNCIACHMPMSGSIDIPHVQVHDHYIRKTISTAKQNEISRFVRLACVSDNVNPAPLIHAKAYLNFYEEYVSSTLFLDSADYFLAKENQQLQPVVEAKIRSFFLRNNYALVISLAEQTKWNDATVDAWTFYRIGESYTQLNQFAKAISFLQKALQKRNGELDFINKLGIAFLKNSQPKEAEDCFLKVLQRNPEHVSANTNEGFVNVMNADYKTAERYYLKAISLNPDYEQALLNYAALCNLQHRRKETMEFLNRVLKLNPKNEQAKALLNSLHQF